MQPLERAIDCVIVDLLAPLPRTLDPAERTAHHVELGDLIGKTVLHLHDDRAAQGVETESWIVGYKVYGPDRTGRNQVPVDSVRLR